ncbi:aconitase-domain-containing protein [Aspergillus heteromorphus CBS 117.55]|uniref:Aconitase-domain-containing protein n=1 Tax=Aspergillus heteromorphus CBS 117.55 TaxID=1448321 RepID=A0A317WWW0_9EURO|nr:aconitase-domain-containing protein [Aspergillus heteromorphus CBS 117.55]PWY90896.1 aconitase-domain-containing protein [Aspergillus heteromorphus CBS 117.55]
MNTTAKLVKGIASHATAPISRQETQTIDLGNFACKIAALRDRLQRPLTYSEKILYSHLDDSFDKPIVRGHTQLKLRPLHIACHDATAQMALIQYISAGMDASAVPTTDLPRALDAHREVYEFMIIHQIVPKNYAIPGGMMIGTDSHTPNAGGWGWWLLGLGVGGADAVDVMAGLPVELKASKVLGVRLTGKLSGWAAPKNIISTVAGLISAKDGRDPIIEYLGPGVQTLSATGMATACNMGAETGATTSIFPYTPQMTEYLLATHRKEMARAIDLSRLEPRINGPFTPDLSTPVSKFRDAGKENEWPELTAGLIGSCINSSFEDMGGAAHLAKQGLDAGLRPKMPLLISPVSLQTREALEQAGILPIFKELGAIMLPNACGPCCGSWDRADMPKGIPNAIITSYNCNFSGRIISNPDTHVFLASLEVVMAKVFFTDLSFNPLADTLPTPTGHPFIFTFTPPTGPSLPLPETGYTNPTTSYLPPPSTRTSLTVKTSPQSSRLQRLVLSPPWSGLDFHTCPILIKTKGKCTTDHITPAGPWFRYRGHLENISTNTLIGAVNAETGSVNTVRNQFTGTDGSVPDTARCYKAQSRPWVIVADHNYGEGSSREHAALQPRYLGGVRVIAKSFARIHEANVKKQGMLVLAFQVEADYDRVGASDRAKWEAELDHSFTWEQIQYFRAGSALNLMTRK